MLTTRKTTSGRGKCWMFSASVTISERGNLLKCYTWKSTHGNVAGQEVLRSFTAICVQYMLGSGGVGLACVTALRVNYYSVLHGCRQHLTR